MRHVEEIGVAAVKDRKLRIQRSLLVLRLDVLVVGEGQLRKAAAPAGPAYVGHHLGLSRRQALNQHPQGLHISTEFDNPVENFRFKKTSAAQYLSD